MIENEEVEEIFLILEDKLEKTVSVMQEEFSTIRAGRANPHVLDKIQVEAYGGMSALNTLGNISALDARCLREIGLILRRGCDTREMTALSYLRRIVHEHGPVRDRLSEPEVLEAMTELKKVTGEAHNFTGFLRFMEGANGVFYGPFSPDNDILDLILPHFLKRFASQPFVIHDTARCKAALYNGKECIVTQTDKKVSVALSAYEDSFQALWKEYYSSVNIAQRPHERQMKGYMPVRYWKYMPEKQ